MPQTMTLTAWLTLTGPTAGATIYQPVTEYLDLQGIQDFAGYLEISNNTSASAVNFDVQCSPTRDSTWFEGASQSANMYALRWALATGTTGVQAVKACRYATATDQLPARYLRWKVTIPATAAAVNVTFRIFINALPVG